MDYDEMVKKILEIFPNAEIGEDDEGRYLGPMGLKDED